MILSYWGCSLGKNKKKSLNRIYNLYVILRVYFFKFYFIIILLLFHRLYSYLRICIGVFTGHSLIDKMDTIDWVLDLLEKFPIINVFKRKITNYIVQKMIRIFIGNSSNLFSYPGYLWFLLKLKKNKRTSQIISTNYIIINVLKCR